MPLKLSFDKARARLARRKAPLPAAPKQAQRPGLRWSLAAAAGALRRVASRPAMKPPAAGLADRDKPSPPPGAAEREAGPKRPGGAAKSARIVGAAVVKPWRRIGVGVLAAEGRRRAGGPLGAGSAAWIFRKATKVLGAVRSGVGLRGARSPLGGKRTKPVWEAPAVAKAPAEKAFDLAEVLGLAIRLGLVALVIAAGLVAVFLNTDAGGSLAEGLRRAAETGAVFSQPEPKPTRSAAGEATLPDDAEGRADEGEAVAPIPSPHLLTPQAAAPLPQLVRLALVSPKKICKAIDPGRDFMSWDESVVLDGQWECYATATADGGRVERREDIEDAPPADDPEQVVEPALPEEPQLFVMARGSGRDTLTTVRVKLVADSAAKAKRGAARLAQITGALFDVLQWRAPDGLLENLQSLTDFNIEQAGTRLRFARELSTGWQYNLIVIFPNPTVYDQGSAFNASGAAEGSAGEGSAPALGNDP